MVDVHICAGFAKTAFVQYHHKLIGKKAPFIDSVLIQDWPACLPACKFMSRSASVTARMPKGGL